MGGGASTRIKQENERLRADLQQKDAEISALMVAVAATVENDPEAKRALSAKEQAAIEQIEAQGNLEENENRCNFECLDAKQLLDFSGTGLPLYQDLKREHPRMLVPFTISFAEACTGVHAKETLTISHRWMDEKVADVDGTQLGAIREHLAAHPNIKRVWCDYSCMVQGERTAAEHADFKRMLAKINLLYLGTSVLILLDLSYLSRFWTQFEAWLSMQQATTGRLRRAMGSERRETILPIYNGTETAKRLVLETWADVSPEQAIKVLGRPDVTVTNQSDKALQLMKLKDFAEKVQLLNRSGGVRLIFDVDRAVGPKPTDRTWRDEWVNACLEQNQLSGESHPRSDYESGGSDSIDKKVHDFAASIQWKVDNGWPREQAEAYTVVTTCIAAPLAAAVHERSGRYAVSSHVLCEVFSEQVKRATAVAPNIYANLTGAFGLVTGDLAWEALLQTDVEVGLSLTTNGVAEGHPASAKSFPDAEGFRVGINIGGKEIYELQESDVVCFQSATSAADGYHSLIRVNELGTSALPPFATVTVEKIEEAGQWEVNGHRVRRRLFTVSVTHK